MKRELLYLYFIPMAVFFLSCTQTELPVKVQQVSKPIDTSPASKQAWEKEWDKILNHAQKEGKIVVYTSAGSSVRMAISERFQSRYNVAVESISGTGGLLTQRILSERRAGIFLADVYIGGSITIFSDLKPVGAIEVLDSVLILPDLTDPQRIKEVWYEGKLNWLDVDHTVLAFIAGPSAPFAINTNFVKAEQISSYVDLLDTRWKGKIVLYDPTIAGPADKKIITMGILMGWDFVRQLAKNDLMIIRDVRSKLES